MRRIVMIGWICSVSVLYSFWNANGSKSMEPSGLSTNFQYDSESLPGKNILRASESREIRVVNPQQVKDAIKAAQPGDVVVMANGVWRDAQIVCEGIGTEDLPVTLRAEERGKVILTGRSNLRIAGRYLVVDGLVFMDGYSSGGGVVDFRNGSGNEATHCRLTHTAIIDYNPPDRLQDYKWVNLYASHNRVDHCYLKGKDHAGTTLVVWLSDQPNYHRIDHNYFGSRPALGQNGGETIRIGTSDWSMHDSYTVVEYNYFERCDGEGEIISNKSCENIYRYNTFFECEGALTLRHGNRCLVEGNFFFGNNKSNTGGIRIIGEDHVVVNNYLENLRGTSSRSALSMVNGMPNSPLHIYFQVKRAVVAFNTLYNCRRNFDLGIFANEQNTLPPEDCTIANNAVYTANSDAPIIIETDKPWNMTYEGNIFYGAMAGVDSPDGITLTDPRFFKADDGLWRPAEGSPLFGAASGDYTDVTHDMDGQLRAAGQKDVGADQKSADPIVRKPLKAEDAGPDWFRGEDLIVPGAQIYPPLPLKPFKSKKPKINQTGYLPKAPKEFSVIADSVSGGQDFYVENENGDVVFTGIIEASSIDDMEVSGEVVFRGDFSELTEPGRFCVRVGGERSAWFDVREDLFDAGLWQMLRFFFLIKANSAIDDPVSGLTHGLSHISDEMLPDGAGGFLDMSGGWYTGSNYGKMTSQVAFACSHLMNLSDANPAFFNQFDLSIPGDDEMIPDLLELVKSGIVWLMKMQRDDGSVFHKVDASAFSMGSYGPDGDPNERFLWFTDRFSTIDAANVSAVAGQAARFFAATDPAFSEQCRVAALRSWNWVKSNPGIGLDYPGFTDPLTWQEEMWAKAEIYMLTGDQSILGSFYNDLKIRSFSAPGLSTPELFGCINLYRFPGLPSVVKGWIEQVILNNAAKLKQVADNSGYRCALEKYYWKKGSNTAIAGCGAAFIYAYLISGNREWLDYASFQLDYLFGRNSLNVSFVTGYGEKQVTEPYHWIPGWYQMTLPGLLVQGAIDSRFLPDVSEAGDVIELLKNAGFPMAKTYLDTIAFSCGNEIDVTSVSLLAYLTGFLSAYRREVSDVEMVLDIRRHSPALLFRNGSLMCDHCMGTSRVFLYNIHGQLLYSDFIGSSETEENGVPLKTMVQKEPLILYMVIDENGTVGHGKLPMRLNGYQTF